MYPENFDTLAKLLDKIASMLERVAVGVHGVTIELAGINDKLDKGNLLLSELRDLEIRTIDGIEKLAMDPSDEVGDY